MSLLDLIKMGFSSLFNNKIRTILTMLGIFIGITSVIALLTLGKSVQDAINGKFTGLGIDQITITSGKAITSIAELQDIGNQPIPPSLTFQDYLALSNKSLFTNALTVSAKVNVGASMKVTYKSIADTAQIGGITPEYPIVNSYKIKMGSPITQEDLNNVAKIAIIGPALSDKFFGNENPIGKTIKVDNTSLKVIGVTESRGNGNPFAGDSFVYIPITTAQQNFNVIKYPYVNEIAVKPISGTNSDLLKNDIVSYLRIARNIYNSKDDNFQVFSSASLVSTINQVTLIFTVFLGCIGGLSLLVGGIGIMNTMLATIAERTKEIGLRKAVGASDFNILTQFLIETFVLTSTGGILGVILGNIIGNLGVFIQLAPTISLEAILLSVIIIFLVSIVFGIYPALRAARLNPIDALKYE